jgi:antitoxin (DNA-binding transcriptional repressor) of toxin-antitoxin stability system
MKIVTIHVAKTQLSQLLAEVEAGEEIVLARGKIPIAKLSPYSPPSEARVFGPMKGELDVGDEILEPLPEEELRAWE